MHNCVLTYDHFTRATEHLSLFFDNNNHANIEWTSKYQDMSSGLSYHLM